MSEIEFTGMKNLPKIKNITQTYGEVTICFSEVGVKTLVNTNDVALEKLAFYLKSGNVLTEISNKELLESPPTSSNLLDSSGLMYYIKKVTYNLSNASDEIIVKFKEKPTSFKGLFAFSPASKISLENIQTEYIQTTEFMFLYCQLLTQLEIPDFNTSNITNMHGMFYFCTSLTALDITDWVISNVEDLSQMFLDCRALTELDLSDWDTSSVTTMNSMFCDCKNLTKVDVSGWVTSNVRDMSWIFANCFELTKLDLSDWNTSSVINMNSMFFACKKLKDLNIETFKQSQITTPKEAKYFLGSDDELEYCRFSGDSTTEMNIYFLRNCSKLISFKKCGICDSDSNDLCEKMFVVGRGYGSDEYEYITKTFHYLEEEIFLNVSERSCYWIAELENLTYFNETLINKYHHLKCDDSCKSCGLDVQMCKLCNDGFYSLYNETSQKRKYCYNKITIDEHFYLFNSLGYRECPSECKTCIQDRDENSINCLSCRNVDYAILDGECFKKKETLLNEKLYYTYDELKNNKIYAFLSNYSKTYYINGNFILQFANENISLTLYNVGIENMNNSYLDKLNLNIFKVNLSSCYKKVIKQYNIKGDLVYGQVDFLDNSNRISYILYDPITNKTINMDICDNMDISISKNVKLTEEVRNIVKSAKEQGYNVVDIDDPFYNDICTPYTNIKKTDITISDRITDIYDNNFKEFIYYDECKFESFNISESNATVKCKTKSQKDFFIEIYSLNTKSLLDNFKFCDASNFYVVACYKKFFSKKGQSNNYTNYIYYFLFVVTLVFLILYFLTGIIYLKNELKMITYSIKFNENKIRHSIKNHANNKSDKKLSLFHKSNNNDLPNSKNYLSDTRLLNLNLKDRSPSNPVKKTSTNMRSSVKSDLNEKRNKNKNLNPQIIVDKSNKKDIKSVGTFKKKENNFLIIKTSSKKLELKNQKSQIKIEEIGKKEENTLESKKENQQIEIKMKKTPTINKKIKNDIDFNRLDFEDALKQDKRTFTQLYLSYIRIKHPMLYLMYDDYNIYAIKCILFIHSFGTHVCTNGLFFQENTMHQIYKDKGLYNFIYRLPLTLYSVIISCTISFGLKKLSLTQRCIIDYKKKIGKFNTRAEAIKKADNIIKCHKIKITIFFVSITLTLFAYWFYIGCFCTVYHNTQFYLIKDSLIGFGLSMIYPFCYLLAAALFRIAALKKKYSCLYEISKMFA